MVIMKMNILKIYNKLIHYNPASLINSDDLVDIDRVEYYIENQTILKSNTLYIMSIRSLLNIEPGINRINVLSFKGHNITQEQVESLNANVILLDRTIDIELIFNDIKNMLSRYRRYIKNTEKLYELVFEGITLQQIIESAYEIINNPIILYDCSKKLIAYTKNSKYIDKVFALKLEDIHVSSRGLPGHHSHKVNNNSEVYFHMGNRKNKYINMVSKIEINHKLVGYLVVIESKKTLDEYDLELISLLSNIISLEMGKDIFYQYSRGFDFEKLFFDLLEESIEESSVLDLRIENFNLESKSDIKVITLSPVEKLNANTVLPYVRNQFDKKYEGRSFIYRDKIVKLIVYEKDNPFTGDFFKELETFLKSNKMYCGLSLSFHNIKDLKQYYIQSVKSIELGLKLMRRKPIFIYDDYLPFHIMEECTEEKELINFCHPSLLQLIEYDKKNNTLHAHTLYSYLMNNKSKAKTASALNISRNTLIYRINQINKIMKKDLKDENFTFKLLFSYKILEFAGGEENVIWTKNTPMIHETKV
jgi:Regulator of polyketide synthase expression